MSEILKRWLSRHPAMSRHVRLIRRHLKAWTSGHPDWKKIFGSEFSRFLQKRQHSLSGPNVLIATSVGAHFAGTTMESALATGLTMRGAQVHVLLCDALLPACLLCNSTWYPNPQQFAEQGPSQDLCHSCFTPAKRMYESLGFKVHRYSDWISKEERALAKKIAADVPLKAIPDYRYEGLAVGEHSLAGALRYFARATIEDEPQGEQILRRYFEAGMLTLFSVRNLMNKISFRSSLFHHGIYIPQGIIGEVARSKKVPVVNWNPAYRKGCFVFSHGDTYHHTLMNEPVSSWENIDLSPEVEKSLGNYLKSRWVGTQDWIWFHEKPEFDLEQIKKEVKVDFSKPIIGMLTNVMWDAQLHYPTNAFKNMADWTVKTIEYFSKRPELQLLIRIHPAEIRGTLFSRQPLLAEIKKAFPILPANVFVIPPESSVSTYVAMSQCNAVIIYGTKTGVELTSMGIPVIVAGEAWIRNKGFTHDAQSEQHYYEILNELPFASRMDQQSINRAKKYAYHFFFRRMIPIEFMEQQKGEPPYRVVSTGLSDFEPGRDVGLDIVCRGILEGTDFIFKHEDTLTPSVRREALVHD